MFDGPRESYTAEDRQRRVGEQRSNSKSRIGAGAYKPLHAESYFGMVGMVLVVIARFGLMPALARRDRDLELDAILNQESYQPDFSFADTNTSRAAVSRTGRTTSAEDRRARSDASLCAV